MLFWTSMIATLFAIAASAAMGQPPCGSVRPADAEWCEAGADMLYPVRARADAVVADGVDAIANAITALLVDDPRVNALHVRVTVDHGVVVLSGRTTSPDERTAAADIAREVNGVRAVVNRIEVARRAAETPTPLPERMPGRH